MKIDKRIKRPILRYHGGDFIDAPFIVSLFPSHKIYVEPFCGAASVLMRKKRSYGEIINDLDDEILNVFRVLQSNAQDIERLLRITPFARKEFELSYQKSDNPIEQARRTIIRSFMGFASQAVNGKTTGFRSNSKRSGTTPAHDWVNYPKYIQMFSKRLQGVVIENRNACKIINQQDSFETLFYVDPPYLPEVRQSFGAYRFEMTDKQHEGLIDCLLNVKGKVVLSHYACEKYDKAFSHWRFVENSTGASTMNGRMERQERFYLSPNCAEDLPLFAS